MRDTCNASAKTNIQHFTPRRTLDNAVDLTRLGSSAPACKIQMHQPFTKCNAAEYLPANLSKINTLQL